MKELVGTVVLLLTVALRCEAGAVAVQNENCKANKQTDYCKLIFQGNLKNCQESGYSAIASNCRVTCNNCTAYNCTNPNPENVLNCTAMADKCTDATFGPFARKNCPATCGTCVTNNAQLCKDVASAETCSTLKAFCNLIEYYNLMTQQCPSTCNRCPSTGQCEDTISNCQAYIAYCNNSLYDALMREKCGKTCNKCTSTATTTSSSTCVDDVRCSAWVASGFCNNNGYSQAVKRQYCPKSCNLC